MEFIITFTFLGRLFTRFWNVIVGILTYKTQMQWCPVHPWLRLEGDTVVIQCESDCISLSFPTVLHLQGAPDRVVQPRGQWLTLLPDQRWWVHHQNSTAQGGWVSAETAARLLHGESQCFVRTRLVPSLHTAFLAFLFSSQLLIRAWWVNALRIRLQRNYTGAGRGQRVHHNHVIRSLL